MPQGQEHLYNQAQNMHRNILSMPPPFLPFDPSASTMNNMMRGLLSGLSAISPGTRFPHVMARNLSSGPRDNIPTISGGAPNAPFGSADIGLNPGFRQYGNFIPFGRRTANENTRMQPTDVNNLSQAQLEALKMLFNRQTAPSNINNPTLPVN